MTFAERVYDAVKHIPQGRVATYGQIAEMIGSPGAARAVGNALHVNPFAPVVPCHRVVASDGSLAANFGCGGPAVQFERLKAEGVSFLNDVRQFPSAGQTSNDRQDTSVRQSSSTDRLLTGWPSAGQTLTGCKMPRVDMKKCRL